jgi:hypothetical protein
MAVSSRSRTRAANISDFIDADARVVALESFRPMQVASLVQRGAYFRLSDSVVRQFPQMFAVLVPVSELPEVIER